MAISPKTHPETDDLSLWQAFKKGDEMAFTVLYQRYIRVLYAYGKKLLSDDELVEDTIQDLFTDLWRMRDKLGDARSVKFYLFRSLRRKIHKSLTPDYLFREDWENTDEKLLPTLPSFESVLTDSENSQWKTDQLENWLKSLPTRQYEALVLKYYQEFDYSEIGIILSINEQSARNLVQKALLSLRKIAIPLLILLLLGTILNF
ncbi:RNA polymerase sigma-70 factor, ECF subfamily [Pseudarcicella hirudinis]|uniref:RNA polymerase sigma-70 factor, ECF subfamily n=1 Tax=Pseudarcicella hirudinis TaxID=1079859 RepID=A0A1I5XQU5_9BACT|nr:sigma-70 family RNA polymerase sigma factor [Pseudarcicella hirudinis]SFQ34342.1 RNA polymerase sigma-70 factor, ECF subfamily [Pseudarcicella hirudinis]